MVKKTILTTMAALALSTASNLSGGFGLPGRAIAASTLAGHHHAKGSALSGTWRIYSATLYYDVGGGGSFPSSTQTLTIAGNRWRWGSSAGSFAIQPIVASDWTQWRVHPYGPTQKIVFQHWGHGRADGPIESTRGRVVFLWVIYHVGPPTVQAPGLVYLKFGRPTP